MQSGQGSGTRRVWIAVIIASVVILGAVAAFTGPLVASNTPEQKKVELAGPQGALIDVHLDSQVGVLLDEIPESIRDRAATELALEGNDFWTARAKDQIHLMSYRLVFRDSYYEESEAKAALPLPPEEVWEIEINGPPSRITTEEGNHDIVLINYTLKSVILTDSLSPGLSEPSLDSIGGKWSEHFVLPLDPTLLFQRTGFACMDENQFPPRSVDPEETDTFYDQETDVEEELSIQGYHQTEMPEMSCIDALDSSVGKIEADLEFERVAWDPRLADQVRVGNITNLSGPDLKIEDSVFRTNRVVYRYIQADDCSLAEGSVGDTGWRRLLQFSAADRNVGGKNLEIGDVDYYIEGADTDLARNGIYEFSICHNHYHFTHYGTFSFGDTENHKMGFCLQSTNRFSNNEYSPLPNRYSGCDYQGIESGWVDEYKAGLEGQWVDVTDIDTSNGPVTRVLSFHSNPRGFLCEGEPVTDSDGNFVYDITELKTGDGHPVYKPRCDYAEGALANNLESYEVQLPPSGYGYVTEECQDGEIGPLRNCGFEKSANLFNCTPGQEVNLKASLREASYPQIIRVCDFSLVLNSSIPCTYNGPHNARTLVNTVVESSSEIVFDCPSGYDSNEHGGKFSIYTAPVIPSDPAGELDYELT